MSFLLLVSGKRVTQAMMSIGYQIDHQTGSHLILRHDLPPYRRLTIPLHAELRPGTLRAIIRQAGLTVEEFKGLLR